YSLFRIPEGEGPELEGLTGLRRVGPVRAIPDPVGEGLETCFPGDVRLALPLLLVGKVEVFEEIEVQGPANPLLEIGSELLLPFDGLEDRGLAGDDPLPALPGREGLLDLDLVEVAG